MSWPSAHSSSLKYTFIRASHARSFDLSPVNTSFSLILYILGLSPARAVVSCVGGAVAGLAGAQLTGSHCVFMALLLVRAGDAVSSPPSGDDGSGVSRLVALHSSWSSAFTNSDSLMS